MEARITFGVALNLGIAVAGGIIPIQQKWIPII
jgi:hypothetical protein